MHQSTTTLHMGQRVRNWAPRILTQRIAPADANLSREDRDANTWSIALAWASGTTFYIGMKPIPVTTKRSRSAGANPSREGNGK